MFEDRDSAKKKKPFSKKERLFFSVKSAVSHDVPMTQFKAVLCNLVFQKRLETSWNFTPNGLHGS
jgi:hypothetical protein